MVQIDTFSANVKLGSKKLYCTFLFRYEENVLPSSNAVCSPKTTAPNSRLVLTSPQTGNSYSLMLKVTKGKGKITKAQITLPTTTVVTTVTTTTTTTITTSTTITTGEIGTTGEILTTTNSLINTTASEYNLSNSTQLNNQTSSSSSNVTEEAGSSVTSTETQCKSTMCVLFQSKHF